MLPGNTHRAGSRAMRSYFRASHGARQQEGQRESEHVVFAVTQLIAPMVPSTHSLGEELLTVSSLWAPGAESRLKRRPRESSVKRVTGLRQRTTAEETCGGGGHLARKISSSFSLPVSIY